MIAAAWPVHRGALCGLTRFFSMRDADGVISYEACVTKMPPSLQVPKVPLGPLEQGLTHTHILTMGLQLTQFPRKVDANGKAAGSVEVKVFNS